MKTMLKFFTTLFLVVMSMTFVQAQDTTEIVVPGFEGTLTLDLPVMAYKEGVLTVSDLPENASWIATSPDILGGLYNTANFVSDWQVSKSIVNGVLITDKINAIVKLSVTDYDAVNNVVTFAVEEVKMVTYDAAKGDVKIPASFKGATLALDMTNDFALALVEGFEERTNTTRTVQTCPPYRPC